MYEGAAIYSYLRRRDAAQKSNSCPRPEPKARIPSHQVPKRRPRSAMLVRQTVPRAVPSPGSLSYRSTSMALLAESYLLKHERKLPWARSGAQTVPARSLPSAPGGSNAKVFFPPDFDDADTLRSPSKKLPTNVPPLSPMSLPGDRRRYLQQPKHPNRFGRPLSSFELHTLRPRTTELWKVAVEEGVDASDASLHWRPTHSIPQFKKNDLVALTSLGPRRVIRVIDNLAQGIEKLKDTRGFVDEDGDGIDDRMQSLSAMKADHKVQQAKNDRRKRKVPPKLTNL